MRTVVSPSVSQGRNCLRAGERGLSEARTCILVTEIYWVLVVETPGWLQSDEDECL